MAEAVPVGLLVGTPAKAADSRREAPRLPAGAAGIEGMRAAAAAAAAEHTGGSLEVRRCFPAACAYVPLSGVAAGAGLARTEVVVVVVVAEEAAADGNELLSESAVPA